jgi:hypothetical protein
VANFLVLVGICVGFGGCGGWGKGEMLAGGILFGVPGVFLSGEGGGIQLIIYKGGCCTYKAF